MVTKIILNFRAYPIWIGFFIIAVALCIVISNKQDFSKKFEEQAAIMKAEAAKPFKTIEWYEASAKRLRRVR